VVTLFTYLISILDASDQQETAAIISEKACLQEEETVPNQAVNFYGAHGVS